MRDIKDSGPLLRLPTPVSLAMADVFEYKFDTPSYKGAMKLNLGLFIDGKWVEPADREKIEYVQARNIGYFSNRTI
jgi:hypothetical protein